MDAPIDESIDEQPSHLICLFVSPFFAPGKRTHSSSDCCLRVTTKVVAKESSSKTEIGGAHYYDAARWQLPLEETDQGNDSSALTSGNWHVRVTFIAHDVGNTEAKRKRDTTVLRFMVEDLQC